MTKKEKTRRTMVLRGVLAGTGISKEKIAEVLQRLRVSDGAERPVRLTRKDSNRISEILTRPGTKAVVIRTAKGIRVFSGIGHQALRDSVKKHMPWKSRKVALAK